MKTVVLLLLVLTGYGAAAQSSTTEALQQRYPEALNLFFYHNTLRMINQQENEEFDELIKDIEKMRFLMIRKSDENFGQEAWTKLVDDYRRERYEPIMTARHDGRNFDVFLKGAADETKGMLVLVNDADNVWVLDILGRIDPTKVGSFLSTLDKNTDISEKITDFLDNSETNQEEDQ